MPKYRVHLTVHWCDKATVEVETDTEADAVDQAVIVADDECLWEGKPPRVSSIVEKLDA